MSILIPRFNVNNGTVLDESHFNLLFNAPVFDDQPQYMGHRARLLDEELSNDPTAIKARFNSAEGGLKVTIESGLTLRYTAGALQLPTGLALQISGGLIVVPDNATSYVFADNTGTIRVDPRPPVVRALLAEVTTVSGVVTILNDLRRLGRIPVAPIAQSIKNFGGFSQEDKVVTQGETLGRGVYHFRNFTVPSGVSCVISRQAKIYCSGEWTNFGVIEISTMAYGAPEQAFGLMGGNTVGYVAGTGLGSRGEPYPWGAQPYGSGGGQANLSGVPGSTLLYWGYTGQAGDGGGSLYVEAVGAINNYGHIIANGTTGRRGGSTAGQPGVKANDRFAVISGSGGGSGGFIRLRSLTSIVLRPGSIIHLKGGNGAQAFVYTPALANPAVALGGNGGSGGVLVLEAPSINTTGSAFDGTGGICGDPDGLNPVTADRWENAAPSTGHSGGAGGGFAGFQANWQVTYPVPGTNVYRAIKQPAGVGRIELYQQTPTGD